MDLHCENILQEYRDNKDGFVRMKDFSIRKIKSLLKSNSVLVTAVEGRVKEEKSLAGKLELKGGKYATLADVTDIVGVRVIAFYSDEVDKIAALIEKYFEVDWENSVDKRKMLDPDQFGYMSLHYVCKLPKDMYQDEEFPNITDYKIEIQMRTALQHVWATAYHDTGYKSDVEVPREYIRALTRLAGMLEIADQQFSTIITDLADYRRRVQGLVQGGKFEDLDLDGDTFKSYLGIRPFDALNQKIASINRAEIQPQNLMSYLTVFKSLGFKTIADVENLKRKYSDDAYRLALLQIAGTDLDILSESIAIQNLCIVYLIKTGKGEEGLKNFYDVMYGPRPRNLNSAKRVIKQAETIDIVAEEK